MSEMLADELHAFIAAAPHKYPGHLIELFDRAEKALRRCSAGSGEEWNPTDEQVRSAAMWYRHDLGLLTVAEAAKVKTEARLWLRSWQKEVAALRAEPQAARADIEDIADIIRYKAYADENDKIGGVHDAAQKIVEYLTTLPARCQAVCAEPSEAQIDAAAEVIWNDRDARMGGPLKGRGADEVCVIQTRATARAALVAALTRPPHNRVEKTNGSQS